MPTALGAGPESLWLLLWRTLRSPRAETYLQESHTCLLLPQAPSAWRRLPGGSHSCRHSCSHVGGCGHCWPSPGRSQGSLSTFLPEESLPGAEPVSFCLAVSTFVSLFVPLTLFFVYFSLSLALVISFCLCLSRPVCSLCPPASCPLCLNSGAGPASPPSSSSGSRRFLPGQGRVQLMILLIFTVSTGGQQATPAALPRCPRSQGRPCHPCASPWPSQCPPGPFCSAVKLFAIQCRVLKGSVGSASSRTCILLNWSVSFQGQVCVALLGWCSLCSLGRSSSLPRWLSPLP